MNNPMRIVTVILYAIFVLIPVTSRSQNLSEHTLTSAGKTLTFIPRPDLGYVIQSSEQEPATQTFQGMLSSIETVESRKIRGQNKRNLTVLMNLDDSMNSAFNILQSQNQAGYKAPLFAVNGQTIAIIPEIVVKLAFEDAYESLLLACNTLDLSIKQKLEFTQKEYLLQVHGQNENSVFDAVEHLNQESFIEWTLPNIASQPVFSGFVTDEIVPAEKVEPNDEYFSKLWHLYNTGQTGGTPNADINAPNAWKITTGDPNIVVAVIDTGVDINHPDLVNNIVPGYDFFDDDNVPAPYLDAPIGAHGTMCAGLVGAQGNNHIGVCGVAWKCGIMPIRIANGEDFVADSDIAAAFRWAASHGADVLSNSWGLYYPSQIIYSAILDVTEKDGIGRDGKGCVVCFAAGNWEDGGPVDYPAARSEVIAVGATDHNDVVWYYSASGPELDIAAPSGGTIEDYWWDGKALLWTTDITGKYGYSIYNLNSEDPNFWDYSNTMSGTSGACPIVAGTAALVLSVDPNLTNIEVRRILLDTAADLGEQGTDEYYGFGRVDANAAVLLALNPPSTPPTSFITLYVDDNAPADPCSGNPDFSDPNEDGTSLHPFDSIQKAINFALFSETIMVLPGIYTGNGNYDIDLLGKPLKIRNETGPENCFIDCQYKGGGFYLHNGESQECLIEGFTITNAIGFSGAGICCINGSSPTIKNCVIHNCLAFAWGYYGGAGGGIYLENGSNIKLNDCIFEDNLASMIGGGICNYYGNLTCNNCSFINNSAGDTGGGIFNLDSPSLTATNCIFTGNLSVYEGGAMYIEESVVALTNCTFASNSSFYGNAIACDYYYSYWGFGSDIGISNSIIWDGMDSIDNYDSSYITISYSDVQKTGSNAWQGIGNINKDPKFADPDNEDFHLKSKAGRWEPGSKTWILDDITSQCIDAGNPSSDFSKEPEPNGSRINMGFYGGSSQASKTFVDSQ